MLVEKKLRDVTKEEYAKWKQRHCMTGELICKDCPFDKVNCGAANRDSWIYNKDIYSDIFLLKVIEVEVKDVNILDDVERKYLGNIIKPFRDKVVSIVKCTSCCYMTKAFIQINTISGNTILPYFTLDLMYKGMQPDRRYTIKELGL